MTRSGIARFGPAAPVLLAAWIALIVSNLIHNQMSLDPAILPATIFGAVYLWKRMVLWHLASAAMIALPSFLFLDLARLTDPGARMALANHWALLIAGGLALVSVLLALRPPR